MREVINALLYLNRSGCQWDMLPHDLAIAGWVRMAGALAFFFAVAGCMLFSGSRGELPSTTPARGNA